ncbi:YqaE/Pmp3 family membrane protein [Shewanella sp. MF05960]|uniref:YqaE/Pmp3 family membrane protein n=1 Tax=Shewanella sp. MF05960 TaxID=3434874 RepID=UPI003D7B9C2C
MDTNKLLLVIIAILLPPLAVFLKKGLGKDLLINILLCFFFFIPGLIHALWVVLQEDL